MLLILFCSQFCSYDNVKTDPDIEDMRNQIPRLPIVEYLLAPPSKSDADVYISNGMLIYCIDVSGSMQATENVPESQGKVVQKVTVNWVLPLILIFSLTFLCCARHNIEK